MLQIKTIIRATGNVKEFDEEVNLLLSEGWKLKKRTIIDLPGVPSEAFNVPVISSLYAELEHETMEFEEVTV